MLNLYESIRSDPSFNKLEIGDLLFAEYTCPIGEERLGVFSSIVLRRPRGEYHPIWNVVITVAIPLIMSVYVGIAQKAARVAVEFARNQKSAKSHTPGCVGAMMNELISAELNLRDMIRIANDLDFKPENQNGQDVLSRKTNVANACIGVVSKAMELAGGQGFYRKLGLERLFRDVQAARYHPLPEKEQQQFLGEYVLNNAGHSG